MCKNNKETILHIMWDCTVVQAFWKALTRWLEYTCKCKVQFNACIIILNKTQGKHREFIDMVILGAKQHIYACKCLEEKLKVNEFLVKLYNMYVSEIIINTNVTRKLRKKWEPYIQQL